MFVCAVCRAILEASVSAPEGSPQTLSTSAPHVEPMKPSAIGIARAVETAARLHFKDPSKVLTTPRAKEGPAATMNVLRCSECGAKIGVVTDHRFGLMPSGTVCISCSLPAFRRARRVALV